MPDAGLYAAAIYDRARPVTTYWSATAGPAPDLPGLAGGGASGFAVISSGGTPNRHSPRDRGRGPAWPVSGRHAGRNPRPGARTSAGQAVGRPGLCTTTSTRRFC
jgi:hypothetical protein